MATTSRLLITAAGIAAVALSGCAKKDAPEDLEFTSAAKSAPAASKKGSADIFDEFYMVDEERKTQERGVAAAPRPRNDLTPPAPAARPQTPPPRGGGSHNFAANGPYVVQVATASSRGSANNLVNELKNLGYPAYVAEVRNPTPALRGTYFRVRIGTFNGYSEAKAFGESALKPAGYSYWVDRKSNDNVGIDGSGFGAGAPNRYSPAPAPQAAPAPAPQRAAPAPAPQAAPAPAPQQVAPAQAPQAAPAPAQAAPAPAKVPEPAVTPEAEPKPARESRTNRRNTRNNKNANDAKAAPAAVPAPQTAPAPTPAPAPAAQAAPAPAASVPAKPAQPEIDTDWDDWEPGDWGVEDW